MTRAVAIAVVALLACRRPVRPSVPDVAGELEHQVERVDLVAARVMVDAQLHAQATAYVLEKAQRRSATVRVARRGP